MLASLLATRKRLLGLGGLVYEVVEPATVERLQTACPQLISLRNFRGCSAVQSGTASAPESLLVSSHTLRPSASSHALKPIGHELGLQQAPRLLHSQFLPLQQSRMFLASCQQVHAPLMPQIA